MDAAKSMLKQAMVMNWIIFAGAFLTAEFFNWNQGHMWPVLAFIVWFMVAELSQVAAGVGGEEGGTFSESAWAFIGAGVQWARFIMIWGFCAALCLRTATVSAEFGGYVDSDNLPYFLGEGPILIVLACVLLWLGGHFWSLGYYGNGNNGGDK